MFSCSEHRYSILPHKIINTGFYLITHIQYLCGGGCTTLWMKSALFLNCSPHEPHIQQCSVSSWPHSHNICFHKTSWFKAELPSPTRYKQFRISPWSGWYKDTDSYCFLNRLKSIHQGALVSWTIMLHLESWGKKNYVKVVKHWTRFPGHVDDTPCLSVLTDILIMLFLVASTNEIRQLNLIKFVSAFQFLSSQ